MSTTSVRARHVTPGMRIQLPDGVRAVRDAGSGTVETRIGGRRKLRILDLDDGTTFGAPLDHKVTVVVVGVGRNGGAR